MKTTKKIIIPTIISLAFHIFTVITILWISSLVSEYAAGKKDVVIMIDVISEARQATQPEAAPKSKEAVKKFPKKKSEMKIKKERDKLIEKKPGAKKEGKGSVGKIGRPGAAGKSDILAQIRAKIERAKRYPRAARRMKIEGRPTVLFQINSDGSVKYVKLAKTSGNGILDKAALETVRDAAPLPYYENPITLKIKYELRE